MKYVVLLITFIIGLGGIWIFFSEEDPYAHSNSEDIDQHNEGERQTKTDRSIASIDRKAINPTNFNTDELNQLNDLYKNSEDDSTIETSTKNLVTLENIPNCNELEYEAQGLNTSSNPCRQEQEETEERFELNLANLAYPAPEVNKEEELAKINEALKEVPPSLTLDQIPDSM